MLRGPNGECLAVRETCSIVHRWRPRPSAWIRVVAWRREPSKRPTLPLLDKAARMFHAASRVSGVDNVPDII
jgi:hypothetical protein